MPPDLFLGVDVGTGSARAGLFDREGKRVGIGVHPIRMWHPREDHAEHSSEDVWRACGVAIRAALAQAGARGEHVAGIGFDATCSLVVVDEGGRPVSVTQDGSAGAADEPVRDTIVWLDHRAVDQAARINGSAHSVLRYVGGTISPEMQTPKLLWLKENLPERFARAARFLDLPDFLVWRATGADVRSLCTTVCKWTYLGHEQRFDAAYYRAIGLGALADEGFARIGARVRPMGERVGALTEKAARELGLAAGAAVGVAIIDAHAGGLGLLGARIGGVAPGVDDFDARVALIGGTSTCHMAVSKEPRFVTGVWGPYFSAMVPGLWLTEGGQSATGALIDHVIKSHARHRELAEQATRENTTVYALLNRRLDALGAHAPFPASLTRDLHVMPDFHGNRSPRADATLRGMISGLKLSDSVDQLALVYLATIQSLAHGTRHVLDALNATGYRIDTLVACGGDVKNSVFVREHADVTGCRVALPREPEAVLLGAAILGAVAAGAWPDVVSAMGALSGDAMIVEPARGAVAEFHERKHAVFHRMHADQLAYRETMGS